MLVFLSVPTPPAVNPSRPTWLLDANPIVKLLQKYLFVYFLLDHESFNEYKFDAFIIGKNSQNSHWAIWMEKNKTISVT